MTQALALMAVSLMLVDLLAFIGVLNIRRHLVGERGFALATIVAVVIGAVVIGDAMSAINAIALLISRMNHDIPVLIYLTGSGLQTAAVLWAFYKVRTLSRAGRRRYDGRVQSTEGESE